MVELLTVTYWSAIHLLVSDLLAGSSMYLFISPKAYASSLAAEAVGFLFLVILLAGK